MPNPHSVCHRPGDINGSSVFHSLAQIEACRNPATDLEEEKKGHWNQTPCPFPGCKGRSRPGCSSVLSDEVPVSALLPVVNVNGMTLRIFSRQISNFSLFSRSGGNSTRLFKHLGGLCAESLCCPISVKTALVLCRCSAAQVPLERLLPGMPGTPGTHTTASISPAERNFLSISCSQFGVRLDVCNTSKLEVQIRSAPPNESNPRSLPPSQESQHAPASGLSGKACPLPRAPHSTSNPCGILAQHWTRSAFCVLRSFCVCLLCSPRPVHHRPTQRPSSI